MTRRSDRSRSSWRIFSNPLNLRSIPRRTRQPVNNMNTRRVRSFHRLPRLKFFALSRQQKLRWLLKWSGYFLGGFILFVLLLFAVYAKDLPNPTNLSSRQVAESTKVLDRNNILLYEIFKDERRTIVKSDQISNYVKQATVAVEDADFYQHHGLDLRSILRAALANLFGRSRFTQGGSTITQQFIKNALLSRERTLSRKIKEAILSIEIETIYSKEEILAGYLNEISYGNNAYGIESAARTYFNKSAAELTLAESATLVAIPQRPTYFSPYGEHKDALFKRKDFILDEMVKSGSITEEEAAAAKNSAPKNEESTFAERDENIKAPHFVFYVRDQLIELFGGDQEAEQRLANGGFVVTTTLDLQTQELAEEAIKEESPKVFERYDASNAAMTAIDPATGEILGMVGSVDFFEDKFGSVNVTTSDRQPGSSFKPIVYATALKGRYNPASILFDLPIKFDDGYAPEDYDGNFRGPVTIRQALANSLNIPAVQMLDLVGIDESLNTAHDLGITTLNDRDRYGLSLVLGAGEVKLLELTHAYSVFGNQGKKMPLTSILKVVDKEGKTMVDITESPRQAENVLDEQVAFLISDILADNATRAAIFGRSLVVPGGHTVAVKTGTTQSFRDAWTVGYTPQIAAGVWVGNNDNTPMRKGADGSTTAAPIWRHFMSKFLNDKENVEFPRPDKVQRVEVDRLSGLLPSDTCSQERLTDWFASWNVPKERDNVHKEVKVDKVSLKLATDQTPADSTEIRCYREIHSRRPDRPNWEDPVRAWAQEHGYSGLDTPPSDYDDVHTEAKRPTVTILQPTAGQTLSGSFEVKSQVKGSYSIDKVEYYLNDQYIREAKDAPYAATLKITSGNHKLKAKAIDSVGNAGEQVIDIIVNDQYPGEVTNVSSTVSGNSITLGWANPADNSLVSVRVYESAVASNLGTLIKTVQTLPNTNSSTVIGGKAAGTWYYTLRPLGSNGLENPTTTQKSVVVP